MADIALLVTEEFERKLKRGPPGEAAAAAAAESRRNFGAVIKVCTSWVDSAAAAAAGVTVNVALLNVDPKTGPAVAAMDGAFSA